MFNNLRIEYKKKNNVSRPKIEVYEICALIEALRSDKIWVLCMGHVHEEPLWLGATLCFLNTVINLKVAH